MGAPPADPGVRAVEARALVGLAASLFEVGGQVERSLTLLDQAEAVARDAGADHLVPAARNNRALLLLRTGETDRAIQAFDQAAALFDVATPFDQACILLNRGTVHLERGALGPARADLSGCAEVAAAAGEALLEFKARHNLGYVEFLSGNLPRALATIAEAGRVDPGGPHAIVLLDQARILREAGLSREALTRLDEAAALFRRDRLVQDLGETELARSEVALTAGEPLVARAAAAAALRLFRRRRNVRWQRKAELALLASKVRLAQEASDPGRDRRLRRLATRAGELHEACRAEGRRDLARIAGLVLAECLLAPSLVGGAQPRSGRRVAGDLPSLRARPGDPLTVRLQCRGLRAAAAEAAGNPAAARREVRAGLAELAAYTSGTGSLDLRTAGAVHGVRLAHLDLSLSLRHGSAAEVFASIERGRAVSTRLAPVRPPGDPTTAELLARLRRVEQALGDLPDDPGRSAYGSRLRALASDLQQQVRSQAWRHESDFARPRLAGGGAVRDALADAGAELVSLVEHDRRVVACVVRPGRVSVHDLGGTERVGELAQRAAADLGVLALPALPPPLRAAVRASLESDLAALDDLLLGQLHLHDGPAVLCPGGALALLPWTALPSRRARPLVVATSATGWLASRARKRGDPARPTTTRPTTVRALAGPGLHRAAVEAEEVARAWAGRGASATAVNGVAATVAQARGLLGAGSDVVHVAAHGLHQTESPLFSSVRMHDGPLYAYELDPADGMAGLVVLSACEVGLSTVRPGDEALGLTSVLLRLGATSVVAGVSPVADALAAQVMSDLHQRLAAGEDVANALAGTLARTLADTGEVAPFVCYGSSWASGR